MITHLSYFKKMKEIIEINDSRGFDTMMNVLYIDLHEVLDSIKNNDIYKKDIKDKFNNSIIPLKDKDTDKLIEFFQENPIDLYNMVLNTIDYAKNICIRKNINITDMGIILYNKIKSECKNNIKVITDDFNLKYENGYFDKEEK